MNNAYLLIGGNTGNRQNYLQAACSAIAQQTGLISKASHLYETAAWGKTDQNAFLNQALLLKTELSPSVLMEKLLKIEQDLGRERLEKYGPRTIDIDILLYNNDITDTDFLKLPHPALPDRRFALAPLAEIAPRLLHPVLLKDISTLLSECTDSLPVKRLNK